MRIRMRAADSRHGPQRDQKIAQRA